MKIIFAPDSFKGSLSSQQVCELLEKQAKKVFPVCETISLPVSDGGEGAVEVVIPSVQGRIEVKEVHDPLGRKVSAEYGIFKGDCVMIEMAAASGITLVEEEKRDIMRANTYGTGELIHYCLDKGYRKFYVTLGGSATNDGGIGCAAALGIRFLDREGREVSPVPENLKDIWGIDDTGSHPALKHAEFMVMCDVTNPLTGTKGATRIFGPQKGGTREELMCLEEGMCHYEKILRNYCGYDVGKVPGAGAAGGLGAAMLAFAPARIESGIQVILKILEFEKLLPGTDLVITGEGQVDFQSVFGKVPFGVASLCKKYGIPCVVIAGSLGEGAEKLTGCGVTGMTSILSRPMSLQQAMEQAEELFADAAERMFWMLKTGMEMQK